MKFFKKLVLLFVSVLAATASPPANESLFVFHANESQAYVYDAGSLELISSPYVGLNASSAIRIDENTVLVAAAQRLVFLGSGFEVSGAIDLDSALSRSPNALAVYDRGNLALVAAGGNLLVVDPEGPSVVKTTSPGFPVGSIAVIETEQRAFVSAAESSQSRYFDLNTLDWQGEEFQLPANFGSLSSLGVGTPTLAYGDKSVYNLSNLLPAGGTLFSNRKMSLQEAGEGSCGQEGL